MQCRWVARTSLHPAIFNLCSLFLIKHSNKNLIIQKVMYCVGVLRLITLLAWTGQCGCVHMLDMNTVNKQSEEHLLLLSFFIPADLWWGVCSALSESRRRLSRNKTHSTSYPTPVVSHYDRDAICHCMTNSNVLSYSNKGRSFFFFISQTGVYCHSG